MHEITYSNMFELMMDVIHDSERGIPVEIICKIEDMKEIISYILPESSLNISYLSFNAFENEYTDDDAISICLSCGEITVCDLITRNDVPAPSGEGHIRYVSSKCNKCYFKNNECIAILKYTMEENIDG